MTSQAVEAEGRRSVVVRADISDETQVAALFDEAIGAFGDLDILMNNAGVDASGAKVAELSTEVFGGQGKIINVTSVHEDVPNAGGADYDCSKGAVRMLTRSLALELAPLGVTVNNLARAVVLTPFNQASIDDPDLLEEQVQSIPLKRAAQPAEIARLQSFSRPATLTT